MCKCVGERAEHAHETGHYPIRDEVKFIDRESHWQTPRVVVGQGFWVYGISGFLISGIQYFYVENGVLSITLF